ncbi:unnamed protein product [Notodromas monacha]|uniref:Hydroxyproline dehydrogenase n=1 Tax=Notodromas monacha TaxID=399045 RepID=A0A7R9BXQ6_9CRUS|nr:unnamed protein product [Notodromas monacha]CAG0922750.1 unnamed protein product [Notodromas monacha]
MSEVLPQLEEPCLSANKLDRPVPDAEVAKRLQERGEQKKRHYEELVSLGEFTLISDEVLPLLHSSRKLFQAAELQECMLTLMKLKISLPGDKLLSELKKRICSLTEGIQKTAYTENSSDGMYPEAKIIDDQIFNLEDLTSEAHKEANTICDQLNNLVQTSFQRRLQLIQKNEVKHEADYDDLETDDLVEVLNVLNKLQDLFSNHAQVHNNTILTCIRKQIVHVMDAIDGKLRFLAPVSNPLYVMLTKSCDDDDHQEPDLILQHDNQEENLQRQIVTTVTSGCGQLQQQQVWVRQVEVRQVQLRQISPAPFNPSTATGSFPLRDKSHQEESVSESNPADVDEDQTRPTSSSNEVLPEEVINKINDLIIKETTESSLTKDEGSAVVPMNYETVQLFSNGTMEEIPMVPVVLPELKIPSGLRPTLSRNNLPLIENQNKPQLIEENTWSLQSIPPDVLLEILCFILNSGIGSGKRINGSSLEQFIKYLYCERDVEFPTPAQIGDILAGFAELLAELSENIQDFTELQLMSQCRMLSTRIMSSPATNHRVIGRQWCVSVFGKNSRNKSPLCFRHDVMFAATHVSDSVVDSRASTRHMSAWELIRGWGVLKLCSSDKLTANAEKVVSLSIMKTTRGIFGNKLFTLAIRPTFYDQFVGGETPEELEATVSRLNESNVRLMLAVMLESDVDDSENDVKLEDILDNNCETYLDIIPKSAVMGTKQNPMCQVKVSGLISSEILAKLTRFVGSNANASNFTEVLQKPAKNVPTKFGAFWESLEESETRAFSSGLGRMQRVVNCCVENKVTCVVDAEGSWLNPGLSAVTLGFMAVCNKDQPVVHHTYQCYLKDALSALEAHSDWALKQGLHFGAKIVRGAYLEKEKSVALGAGIPCPLTDSYQHTNANYDRAVEEIILKISAGEKGVHSHCLGSEGVAVYKSVPYGELLQVLPYLARRAQENAFVLKGPRAARERHYLWSAVRHRFGFLGQ